MADLTLPTDQNVPFLFDGFATGAIWRPADPRDFDMRRLPGVARMLRVGYPPNDEHLKEHVWATYNQGASPSCVAHMTAGLMSTNEHIERNGQQMLFDAMALHLETGPADQGRWPGDILKVAQERGVPLVGSSKRYRIGSYSYAPTTTAQEWVDTMKAAMAAGHVCGIASRLWSNFSWETSGELLDGRTYHEYLAVGYRSTPGVFGSCLIKNSWGSGFGQNGFAWVPFELMVMQNFQDRYLIGNTVIDAIDDDLGPLDPVITDFTLSESQIPAGGNTLGHVTISMPSLSPVTVRLTSSIPAITLPNVVTISSGQTEVSFGISAGKDPPGTVQALITAEIGGIGKTVILTVTSTPSPVIRTAIVTGKATAGESGGVWPVPGQTVALGVDVRMTIQTIVYDDTPPDPVTLAVTGYDRPSVQGGETFKILGAGFTSGNLLVSWGGQVLSAFVSGPTRIDVTAPRVTTTASNPVQVRIEGAVATGPSLEVRAEDSPPVGEILVTIQPPTGGRILATATLDGRPIATQMKLCANGVDMGARNVPAGSRGNWPVPGPAGTRIRVDAVNLLTGQQGSAERTL